MQMQSLPFFRIKDIDPSGRTVQFYGSAFGNIDSDEDIMVKGAFAKTIQENGPASLRPRIQHLSQHNRQIIIGKFTELVEDEFGLLCTSILADNADGNDALALYELNVYEHSVGFNTIKQEYDGTTGIRRLTEVKLWEVSAVTWGANEMTPLVGIKDLKRPEQIDYLNTRMDKLVKALRTGNMQDSTYENLQAEADSLQAAYKELFSLPVTTEPAPVATSDAVTVEPAGAELVETLKKSLTFLNN
jgi:HK97 family phage prohead protease